MEMVKKIFYILVLCIGAQHVCAKQLDSLLATDHKEFYLDWDNDMYLFRDYYYTQGAHIYYMNPGLRRNPVNHILFHLPDADQYYSLGIVQEIYTPKDVHDSLLNVVDRPYAGTLYIRSSSISVLPEKRLRFTSQFDLGVLGPLSGSRQAQEYIHDWLGLGSPEGWDFQIQNRPYLNYNVEVDKGVFALPGYFDFMLKGRMRLGNIHDDVKVGAMFRMGRMNNYFKGFNLGNKKYAENRLFQAFFYAGANASLVLYNATLMGGIVSPESNHQFKYNEIEPLIGEVYGGIHLSYKYVGVRGQVIWKTKEFEQGVPHGWGTVSLYVRF